MKKLKFKILSINIINKKLSLKEVEGYQIDSIAAVYRDHSYWYVTELESGVCISKGKTKQDAINKYQEVETKEHIKNAHKTDVYKHFKKEFKEMEGQKLK